MGTKALKNNALQGFLVFCFDGKFSFFYFVLFKQMMVRRNRTMNAEAMDALKKKGGKVDKIQPRVSQDPEEMDEEMERAIAESKAIFVS